MSNTLSPWPVVQNGSQGHPIRTLQLLLRARGHNLAVDGIFGSVTEAAVKAFQTAKGITADGVVAPQTWSALIIQVKRGVLGTRFGASKRNSSSALANLVKGSRWMESSDHKRTARSEASNTLCRSTFHLSQWMGLSVRSLGRRWSAACCRDRHYKCVTTEFGFTEACNGRT